MVELPEHPKTGWRPPNWLFDALWCACIVVLIGFIIWAVCNKQAEQVDTGPVKDAVRTNQTTNPVPGENRP